jgi:hypothetical protein
MISADQRNQREIYIYKVSRRSRGEPQMFSIKFFRYEKINADQRNQREISFYKSFPQISQRTADVLEIHFTKVSRRSHREPQMFSIKFFRREKISADQREIYIYKVSRRSRGEPQML